MNKIKIVIIDFGSPNKLNKPISVSNISCNSAVIYKIPAIGEEFMVLSDAYEDRILKCVRVDESHSLNSVENHDCIVIAEFMSRLSSLKHEKNKNIDRITKIKDFIIEK